MPTAGNLSERVLRLAAGRGKRPENGPIRPCSGNWCACTRKYPALGLDSLYHMLKPAFHCPGEGVHRLMKAAGIHSQRKRAYKATTQLPPQLPHRAKPAPTPVHFQPPQPSLGGRHHLHPHRGRLAVFSHCQRPVHQENRGVCLFPAHRHPAHPGRPEHGRPPGAPCPGLIFHSDRVRPVRRRGFRERLASLGVRQSMSRKGDPYDNAVAENFFSCLKCELVHLRRFDSRRAAQADLFHLHRAFYNTIRPHSSLGWLRPAT